MNVASQKNCYGCGVCAAGCPKGIIDIKLNKEGFYEPSITEPDKCIACGICLDICAFSNPERAVNNQPINSFASWSNDDRIRRKCSSGGIGFEIAKSFVDKGYKVVACRYNVEKERAEHYIAQTIEDLVQSTGSKYIQSYTLDAFKEINKKEKYLVVGTPCQIDSFRRYIQKFKCEGNFVLMDFFCHCVPSMFAWKAYTKMQEKKVGKITYASWRNKFEYGWHDSWIMGIDGKNTSEPIDWHDSYNVLIREKESFIKSRMSQGDLFYKLFLGDIALGVQCQTACKYKYDKSSADIRIGDLWGNTYKKDEKGVSALIAFTEKGMKIIGELKDVTLVEHPFDVVAEGQMKSNARAKEMKPIVMHMLKRDAPLDGILFRLTLFTQRVITKLISLL
ncbi:Coenzyme F420 hydrogenase/dehydrogenase, beta subunit C-terminal domain [Prevotella communis]|uniref:Coenzyme F420 hydrogenase/dehydrogenase, beta subunit C-terminal domain n=1 Tax=Prevotella communis TaxID=2913614 RepID=UPI001EDC39A0|nr:Coenzyme F420 hydrogenase/dehydrogenase, beta subunit C-terminal domain [Prevotella communis]UKK59573.1 Coenzyme F420 hydrogenase/dehydrogenase, beta subunit C-terminal domain [Prevotella communis]